MSTPDPYRVFRRWPDLRRGPWRLTFDFEPIAGRLECTALDIRHEETGERAPITSALVRSLPVAGLIDEMRAHVPEAWEHMIKHLKRGYDAALKRAESDLAGDVAGESELARIARNIAETAEELVALGETDTEPRRSGRPAHWTPERMAEVARVYLGAWGDHDNAPTRAVADHFSLSHGHAAKLVHRARGLGLLGPTQRGKAGPGAMPDEARRSKSNVSRTPTAKRERAKPRAKKTATRRRGGKR